LAVTTNVEIIINVPPDMTSKELKAFEIGSSGHQEVINKFRTDSASRPYLLLHILSTSHLIMGFVMLSPTGAKIALYFKHMEFKDYIQE
jgi:hypothetical protein